MDSDGDTGAVVSCRPLKHCRTRRTTATSMSKLHTINVAAMRWTASFQKRLGKAIEAIVAQVWANSTVHGRGARNGVMNAQDGLEGRLLTLTCTRCASLQRTTSCHAGAIERALADLRGSEDAFSQSQDYFEHSTGNSDSKRASLVCLAQWTSCRRIVTNKLMPG